MVAENAAGKRYRQQIPFSIVDSNFVISGRNFDGDLGVYVPNKTRECRRCWH